MIRAQTNVQVFVLGNVVSIFGFLNRLEVACDSSRSHEGATMRLLSIS